MKPGRGTLEEMEKYPLAKLQKLRRRVAIIGLSLVSIVLSFVSTNNLYYDASISENSAIQIGTIEDKEHHQSTNRTNQLVDHYDLYYTFSVDGKDYTKTDFFKTQLNRPIEVTKSSYESFQIGSPIEIIYDSKDPYINKPKSFKINIWLDYLYVIGSVGLIIFSISFIFPKIFVNLFQLAKVSFEKKSK